MKIQTGNKPCGFTLIELMIVVAIIGILAAIALPSYTSYVVKARRADVQSELTKWAQSLERYYSTNGKYNSNGTTCGVSAPSSTNSNDYYTFNTSTCDAATFTLTAVPTTTSSQNGDGSQSLDNTGVRTGTWAK